MADYRPMTRDDLWPGRLCRWLYAPRGGYGFGQLIPCKVLSVTKDRVGIEVERRDGSKVTRHVKPGSLRTADPAGAGAPQP